MSAPAASLNADDDGPEEGEIEDDDDDIIIVEGNTKAPVPSHFPHVSSATSTKVHQSRSSTASKDSYERDIRNFELRKNRATRSRRTSGSTKSPHSSRKDDTRTKSKYSRTGWFSISYETILYIVHESFLVVIYLLFYCRVDPRQGKPSCSSTQVSKLSPSKWKS